MRPAAQSPGRVLITSRLRNWPATVRIQSIETLLPEDARRFLLQRTEDKREAAGDDAEQAERLAELLDGLPLALEQAAAYVSYNQMRLEDYLAAWKRQREAVLGWYDSRVIQYPASVAVTWKKTFDGLGITAGTLLRLTAFLAPDPIPEEMFEMGEELVRETAELLAEETKGTMDAPPVTTALADLAAFSMITRQKGQRFVVHRLVQEVLRSQVPEERRKDWVEGALAVVERFTPADDPEDVRTWPVWDLLRPHVSAVVEHAAGAGIREPTSRLMNNLGLLLHAKSLYAEAEPLMRRALAIDEGSFGGQHPEVATSLITLAHLLHATNRLAEAEPLMRRALAIDEGSFGAQHPEVATDLNNLAQLLNDTNRLTEAEPLMRRALAIDEGFFGAQHPEVATDLNNLAALLQTTNRLVEAEPLMRRALDIDENSCGPQHPKVARDLNNLARLLEDTDRLEEAERLMRRALAISEGAFGPQHPNVATHLNNLAQLLQDTNRFEEAERLMRRAFAISEGALGPQHPRVAVSLIKLAHLLQTTDRLAEAEPLIYRALSIDECSYGPQHPEVATDLSHLSWLLKDTNRVAEAEPLLRRAVEIYETSLGSDHPKTHYAQRNLALMLEQPGPGEK